jgi:hypothetical protein
MAPKILTRQGIALAQSLIVFPFCLSVVAMSAMSPAFSALRRYQPAPGYAAFNTGPEPRSIELQAEDALWAESSDEGTCGASDDLD